jgi:hypothetical protein
MSEKEEVLSDDDSQMNYQDAWKKLVMLKPAQVLELTHIQFASLEMKRL